MGSGSTDSFGTSHEDIVDICTSEVYGDDPNGDSDGWGCINGNDLDPDQMDEIDEAGGIDVCIARRAARSCAECLFFGRNPWYANDREGCELAESNPNDKVGAVAVLCVDARQTGAPCGPEGRFWHDRKLHLIGSDLQEAVFGVDPVTGSWPRRAKDSWFSAETDTVAFPTGGRDHGAASEGKI